MKKFGAPWTSEEVAILRKFVQRGKRLNFKRQTVYRQAAIVLGRTWQAVRAKIEIEQLWPGPTMQRLLAEKKRREP